MSTGDLETEMVEAAFSICIPGFGTLPNPRTFAAPCSWLSSQMRAKPVESSDISVSSGAGLG